MHDLASLERRGLDIPDKYLPHDPSDVAAVQAALEGSISGTSEPVQAYESALAAFFGVGHAVAASSGAAAIVLALHAIGVAAGDEVVLTPTCPLCTVYPIIAAGAVPVFCDTGPDHFGADLADLERVVTAKTRAILDIPMWGYPTPADELAAFAAKRGLALVFDLAHAHGTTLQGRSLAVHADISCFSTHDRKPLSTGEGGFLLCRDRRHAERARSYSRFGDLNGRDLGLNYKLSGLQAALGLSRLKRLGAQIAARRRNAQAVTAALTTPLVSPLPVVAGGEPNYYSLLLRTAPAHQRQLIAHLSAAGVPSDISRYDCKCLYRYPAVERFARACPNAEALLASITTIPVHPGLGPDELSWIAHAVNRFQP